MLDAPSAAAPNAPDFRAYDRYSTAAVMYASSLSDFLADRTATQYDRLLPLLSSVCPSVHLSVTLCIVALGSVYNKFESRQSYCDENRVQFF